jgi:hypothetical protein
MNCKHNITSGDDCLLCKIEQLESENAELKAQHERDEKAMRVLAIEIRNADCSLCAVPTKDCEAQTTLTCKDTMIAYAKQDAGKSESKEQENDKTK